MKIISWNTNGIRATECKGELFAALEKYDPDLFLVQETKAQKAKLTKQLIDHPDYEQFYNEAEKPGYSGTAIWAKKEFLNKNNLKPEFIKSMPGYQDNEGRIAQLKLADWRIFSVYFPNGGKSQEAWQEKLFFYDEFLNYLNSLRAEGLKVVFGGDVNCAHQEIDLARPKDNDGKIGFHPEERKRISNYIEQGWLDIYRELYPQEEVYSWWHLLTKARERNVGWRIDYFFVDKPLKKQVKKIEYLNEQMGSDHCPVSLEIKL